MRQDDIAGMGFTLLFAPGSRPSSAGIVELLGTGGFAVGNAPDPETGLLEVVASGLAFDLRGLAPAAPAPRIEALHAYGFGGEAMPDACEAVELVPTAHIAAGVGLDPVLRALVGLAANIVLHLPVAAIAWPAAGTVMEPRYFSRVALNWLGGGAFPALGLTALAPTGDGGVASTGLARFTGQEFRLEALAGEGAEDALKLAARLVEYFVRNGPITEPQSIEASSGALVAEPSQVGNLVLVWRQPRGR